MYINCFFIKNWRLESMYFDHKDKMKYVDKSGYSQKLLHQMKKIDGKIIIDN